MQGRNRASAITAVIVAFGLVLVGCRAPEGTDAADSGGSDGTVSRAASNLVESDDQPKAGGKIVYGLSAESNGWNPGLNQWGPQGMVVARALFDTLAIFGEDGRVHPNLAERFDHNADFTEWTITIRRGVVLSNGKPVTADTVVRSQEYLRTSPVTGVAYGHIESFRVLDEHTLLMKAKQRWVDYPKVLASQVGVVVDPDWLVTNDSLHPVGTGAFTLDQWQVGDKLVVNRNPRYWQKDRFGSSLPYLDQVEFRVITDADAQASALRSGDIDLVQTFSGVQIQHFQDSEGFQVFTDPEAESDENFIQLNTQVAPFDDVDARRALAYATDKQTIIDIQTGGFDEPANGPYPKSSRWYAESGYPQYDPAKARELVEQVKARHGGAFTFTLAGSSTTTTQTVQQVLQQQWADVGIDVKLQTLEQSTMVVNAVTGNYQAVTWYQFSQPDPLVDSVFWEPALALPPPAFTLNFARWKDQAVGDAIVAASGTEDEAEVKAQWAIVQQRMGSEVPYVWLYHQAVGIIATTKLVNIGRWTLPDGSPGLGIVQGGHPLFQVWIRS